MWNVWLGLQLIAGAGGAATSTTYLSGGRQRVDRRLEQQRREDAEMVQLAGALIGALGR